MELPKMIRSTRAQLAVALLAAGLAGCQTTAQQPPQPQPQASLLEQGLSAGRAGDFAAMSDLCRQATREPNADPRAFVCVAEASLKLGAREQAKDAYLAYLQNAEGVEPNANVNDARLRLAELYIQDGQYGQAIRQAEALIDRAPSSVEGHTALADAHRLMGECGPAITRYKQALDLNADYAPASEGLTLARAERACKPAPTPTKKAVEPEPQKEFRGGGAAISSF
jgi:Tfp pilus assembly protein PilF